MKRAIGWVILPLLVVVSATAQESARRTAFEVATVKASAPLDLAAVRRGEAHIGTKVDGGRVDIGTASLLRLICTAYGVPVYQVRAPDWLKTANFDIQAKLPDGASADKIPQMLQALLEDRFGLRVHHQDVEQNVYALVVAKGGAKLKESAYVEEFTPKVGESMTIPTLQGVVKLARTAQGISMEMPDGEITGKLNITMNSSQPPSFHIDAPGTSMRMFAAMLSVGVVDRPVIDMTGLKGTYDVAIELSAEDARRILAAATDFGMTRANSGDAASDPTGASVMSSVQKLGLRLEARKAPLDAIIVDAINRTPTDN